MVEKVDGEEMSEDNSNFTEKMRSNPWMVSTAVLGVLSLILLVFVISPSLTGNVVSSSSVGNNLADFAIAQGVDLQVLNVADKGSYYEVEASIDGQNSTYPMTKDGKYLIAGTLIPITGAAVSDTSTGTQTQANVPKTDKPVADFFVFAYCPYGTQMEKALLPVYNLLKAKADINIVYIGAMHGEYEHVESLRQIAILQNYGKDKLFAYLDKFLANTAIGDCNGVDTCVNPLINIIYSQLGIDGNKINTFMQTSSEAIYAADEQKASSLGISGSPSVTINGVQATVGRSPVDVQTAICSAFNTAPAECSQALSSTQESAGFGSAAGTGSSASCG